MLNKLPIDPRERKKKTGWAASNAFEIDVVAVTEKKAHILMRNCRRLRDGGSLIEEVSDFMRLRLPTRDGKCKHSQVSHFQLKLSN